MNETFAPYPESAYHEPRSPVAWVTWLILGSTVAVFLLQLRSLHLHDHDTLGDALAFSHEAWAQGHWWTLFTYAWAHATAIFGDPDLFWLHVAANMIPLLCLGPTLEELLGHLGFLALYLGGVLASVLVWAWLNPGVEEGIMGASGAVFGLIGAAGAVAPRARVTVYLLFVLPIPMQMGVVALVACGFEALQAAFGWMPEVAHSAHLGGAAFGALFAGIWRLVQWRRHRMFPG